MQREDMEAVRPLGEGTSGVVQLVRHKPTDQLMALKVGLCCQALPRATQCAHDISRIRPALSRARSPAAARLACSAAQVISLGISERERKQILQELRVLHRALVHGERADMLTEAAAAKSAAEGAGASSEPKRVPSIISFFGAFYADGAIHIALEYMDRGSLHDVLRHTGPIDERLLACIATQVLRGLEALQALKIVHRDVKPGNVLLNSAGDIKLADLGMCGELANSFSRLRSWVGTAAYMSPERISGADYSFNSDVWSLGVSLWECATGRYPFGAPQAAAAVAGGGERKEGGLLPEEASAGLTFWELLHNIVEGDALDDPMPGQKQLSSFLAQALRRSPAERPDAKALLQHEWIAAHSAGPDVLQSWVKDIVSRLPVAGADRTE